MKWLLAWEGKIIFKQYWQNGTLHVFSFKTFQWIKLRLEPKPSTAKIKLCGLKYGSNVFSRHVLFVLIGFCRGGFRNHMFHDLEHVCTTGGLPSFIYSCLIKLRCKTFAVYLLFPFLDSFLACVQQPQPYKLSHINALCINQSY